MNPIVVSTLRPLDTAHSDAPAPRWQVTTRSPSVGRPSSSAVRRAAYACESPWKPNRRTGQRSRQAAGTAYVAAARGIPEWKAVSKQATDGMPPKAFRVASIPARARGWCSGASEVRDSMRERTASSTITGEVSSAPPCTTRWPTASKSHEPAASPSTEASPSQSSRSCCSTISSASSRTLSFRLEDPALTTSTLMTAATSSRAPPAGPRRARARSGGAQPACRPSAVAPPPPASPAPARGRSRP